MGFPWSPGDQLRAVELNDAFSSAGIAGGTGAFIMPAGTTAQRPNTGDVGNVRYNTTTGRYEFGVGGSWLNHVKLTGDTMTGQLTVTGGVPNILASTRIYCGDGTNASSFVLNGITSAFRGISFQTATVNRWSLLHSGTESGSNSGSDLTFRAFADDGATTLADMMTLRRALKAIDIGVGGTLNISGRSVSYGGLNISQAYTSTSAPTVSGSFFGHNKISINGDDAAIGIANTAAALLINANYGGANMTGSRALLQLNHTQTAPSGNVAAGNNLPFYVTLYAGHQVNSGDGGTSLLTTGASGGGFAFNPQVSALSGATFLNGLTIVEANLEARAGSSVRVKTGYQIVKTANDAVKGSAGVDTALGMFDQGGVTVGWDYAIRIGGSGNAQWPLDQTTGTVMGISTGSNYTTTGAMTAGYGIDLSEATFATTAFRSLGCSVDGAGVLQLGTGLVAPIATGMSVDVHGAVGTGTPTINAGGSGFAPSASVILRNRVYGAVYVGLANVSGVITSITSVRRQPVANVNTGLPATLTLTAWAASDGTGCVVNVTWDTSQTELRIQPTAGGKMGFNGATPIVKPTGVAVTAAGVHAALVSLGLIAA